MPNHMHKSETEITSIMNKHKTQQKVHQTAYLLGGLADEPGYECAVLDERLPKRQVQTAPHNNPDAQRRIGRQ